MYNNNSLFVARNSRSGYEIDQSLRFNSADSAYLNRTSTQSATNNYISTTSVWVKRAAISTSNFTIFGCSPAGSLWGEISISNHKLQIQNIHSSGGTSQHQLISNDLFRDGSAWYHIVVMYDTTQSTASNRTKAYVNNRQITSWGTETYLGQNIEPFINSHNYARGIGKLHASYSYYFDGYLAEFHHVDGQSLTPSSFGETDPVSGAWIPKRYGGTYGANGFYLKFDPTATNGIGHDHSGNGNNWTATGFSTSGTGTDVMSDTPTTNWCTFNPVVPTNQGSPTFSDGNLVFQTSGGGRTHGTFAVNSGKFYWEITAVNNVVNRPNCGIVGDPQVEFTDWAGEGVSYDYNGSIRIASVVQGGYSAASWSNGDIIGHALDLDSGSPTIKFYKNNTLQATVPIPSGKTNWRPAVSTYGADGNTQFIGNFGQRAFAYTPPTGYKALNTANLPEPSIKDGGKYFNTVLYNGNGSESGQAITGVGFQPDFLWIKNRGAGNNPYLADVIRGATTALTSPYTSAEYTQNGNGYVSSFDTDGFTVIKNSAHPTLNGGDTNASSNTYVAWNWLAGGTGSSNTAGSITSTVSANASAGFSIVSYTGTGSAATVGHGLGVAPSFVITKDRGATYDWYVYHKNLTSQNYLKLNETVAQAYEPNIYSSAPSSTVINYGSSIGVTRNTANYVAYCFSEVAGYSKFGSYTGNGSSDGPFCFCGFRPAFILRKSAINAADDWVIQDVLRPGYNETKDHLTSNQANAEVTGSTETGVDILSNGFKVRSSNYKTNYSGATYIFAAFAENPFGGSNTAPANAR